MDEQKNLDRQIFVIIPVYNCKNYLETAVSSVENQKYALIEIILVDDGSTDGSSLLCTKLAKKYNNIHEIHQKNSGVSVARNVGIKYALSLCRGREEITYFLFLDADDAWMPHFFDSSFSRILMNGYDLIGFQSCLCNCNLTRRAEPIILKDGEYTGGTSSVWLYSGQSFGAMLYKASFLNFYQIYFKNLEYSEDKIFSMQCMYLADKIYLINRLLYLYRQNYESAMKQRTRGISYYIPIISAYLKLDQDMFIWKNIMRGELHEGETLARIYLMDMIEEHFQFGGNKKQLESFWKSYPMFYKILESTVGGEQVTERWLIMLHHPNFYIFKNRIKGFLRKFIGVCAHIGIFRKHIEKMRYPVEF